MDAQRFDNLARSLAGRISRRGALRRAGAAASAGLLASAGLRPTAAAVMAQSDDNSDPVYTVIRRYTLNGQSKAVRQALAQGYVEDACKAKGFIAYFTVEDEDGDFVTIAVFRSQDDFEAFADDEAEWIAENLADLLPSPDEAISGQSFIHAGSPQAFRDTCPGSPSEPTVSPAQPTAAAPTATAAPPSPTATPEPCTSEGCVCATGTRRPCDRGLVCCPTTDLMGGPGICKTEEACHPNTCVANGGACPQTCGGGDSCPGCCSNFCDANDQCADPPSPPCTSEGCDCTDGTQGACDAGLVCCGTTNTPGGPGVCRTEAECNPPCTGVGCQCDYNDPSTCDPGLNCCAVQSGFICATQEQCPCTSQGCACNGGVQGNCDAGLVCCQEGQAIPGGAGTCQPEAQCAPPPCTGQGCDCNGGVQGACDDGFVCCQNGQAIPGGAGTCQPQDQCAPPPCTGEGCACNGGVQGACDPGLVCCQEGQSIPGGPGTCQPAAACGPPPCTDIGGGCDATCNWGDSCPGCCTGFCNSSGLCDNAPSGSCTSEGCQCATGTLGACDDGLECCSTGGDPGAPGVCQASC